jgi:hypothetical protein
MEGLGANQGRSLASEISSMYWWIWNAYINPKTNSDPVNDQVMTCISYITTLTTNSTHISVNSTVTDTYFVIGPMLLDN